MSKYSKYWLMDGRANYDVDKAMVLETCDTLEEARSNVNHYGADTCIVDVETQVVIYSLMWKVAIIKIVYKATTRRDFLLTIDEWTKDDDYYYFLYRGKEVHREKRSDVKAVRAV